MQGGESGWSRLGVDPEPTLIREPDLDPTSGERTDPAPGRVRILGIVSARVIKTPKSV